MKQIIVNVSGLSVEEKQRVNEALACVSRCGAPKITNIGHVEWLYADERIAWSYGYESWVGLPETHTPQQVLEMARMETSTDQHVFLADKFVITDSSGRIVYDGTLESISSFIESRASAGEDGSLPSSGFSVKTDENGVAVMAAKRKVRAGFDPKQPISVDVSGCAEDEKKEVQQAFFDVGIKWSSGVARFRQLNAKSYSNSTSDGSYYEHLMFGTPRTDSITPQQFLSMVYEPDNESGLIDFCWDKYQAGKHTAVTKCGNQAKQLHKFETEAKYCIAGLIGWDIKRWSLTGEPFDTENHGALLMKPKTHIVNGVEVPDLRFVPKKGDRYYLADPTETELTHNYGATGDRFDTMWAERGLCYEPTEEGKQAAILHAKAWLGIA